MTVSGRPNVASPKGVRVINSRYGGAFVQTGDEVTPSDAATAKMPRTFWSKRRTRQDGHIYAPLGGLDGAGRLQSVVSASLPVMFERVQIQSNFSPPTTFATRDLVSSSEPSPVVKLLQPTITLSGGSLGTQILAPAGQASPDAWKWNLAKLLGSYVAIFALSSYTSYRFGKRAGRRSR